MLNRLKEVFKSFQDHEVKYLVIGGIASILHGVPRATFDKEVMTFKGQQFYVLAKDDLIASKKAAGRKIDIEDVKMLGA